MSDYTYIKLRIPWTHSISILALINLHIFINLGLCFQSVCIIQQLMHIYNYIVKLIDGFSCSSLILWSETYVVEGCVISTFVVYTELMSISGSVLVMPG